MNDNDGEFYSRDRKFKGEIWDSSKAPEQGFVEWWVQELEPLTNTYKTVVRSDGYMTYDRAYRECMEHLALLSGENKPGPEDITGMVLTEIENERTRQKQKWGHQHHSAGDWLLILIEEVGEASQAILQDRHEDAEKELYQVAAVAAAWLEDILAGKFTPDA